VGYADEAERVPRPALTRTPDYFCEEGYRADEYPGSNDLAASVRRDIAEAKKDGRLPSNMRTLVSVNLSYATRLTLTVRGVTEDMIWDEPPTDPGIVYARAGIGEGAIVETQWTMNRDWALALLQLLLIGTAYDKVTKDWHDDYPSRKYSTDLYVQGIGSFSAAHLMVIEDE